MNESSITIRWEKNSDGSTDISVSGDINYQPHFREVFLSLSIPPSLHDINEDKVCSESAAKSATIALLVCFTEIIRKSDKTNGYIISEQERNSKFPFTDLVAIRRFAEIVGIKFDERKFRNRKEFKLYFQSLLKDNTGKEC